jgi:phosphoserine phosphatase RsbU/P
MEEMSSTKCPVEKIPDPSDDPGKPLSTILVVDDSRVVRTYLQVQLQREGYGVLLAKDGSEAMELLTDDIGIVLVDLWMPGMDGMACLRHIRENFPEIPAIMITVSHEISHAVEAMKYGAFDFVTKPFNPDALLALVKQAMRSRRQSHQLKQVESELRRAREHEAALAMKIQQTLLLGGRPTDFHQVKIGEFTMASKNIDGDFHDFFRLNDQCFDIIVGDVMGKGIPAALLGAAARHHFMSVLFRLVTRLGAGNMLPPAEIVQMVHGEMIEKMKDLETFFTLCYTRFDLSSGILSYVDCGHVRTIHCHSATNTCSLLQGVNMPLGFPGQDQFTQIQAPFSPGDLFFFYSDGLTEAKNPDGYLYGEDRLKAFIERHCFMDPQDLCRAAWRQIVEFSGTDAISDDFTCVAVKIEEPDPAGTRQEWKLEVRSDPGEIERVRVFIHDICRRQGSRMPDEEVIKTIQIVCTEIMTNIMRHAYQGRTGESIRIEARVIQEELLLKFFDQGIAFNFGRPSGHASGRTWEDGMGLHIIRNTAESVSYTRDEKGLNCACVRFSLRGRGVA